MAQITFQGNPFKTIGELPQIGSYAPDFRVVKSDLSEITLKDYSGKRLILNIFPSVDTPTCATSVKRFNEEASKFSNNAVLCISADLPFALGRFCGSEGIENVEAGSTFRTSRFGVTYGVEIITGPIKGLLSRAIVVIDPSGKVTHTEQVAELIDEPNYERALASL